MSRTEDLAEIVGHIRRWQGGESPPPLKLTLGTTYVCNLRCRFCAQRHGSPQADLRKSEEELSEERLLRLVEEAAELGVKTVCVSGGGEPFLRKKTLAVMKAIKEHGMSGGITTNGMLIPEDAILGLVRVQWDRIDFSIDGPDAKTHDYLRDCRGAFNRTTRAIKRFSSSKEGVESSFPILAVTTVLTNRNHERIHEIVRLAHHLGAQVFTLTPLIVHHPEGEQFRLREEHWPAFKTSLAEAEKIARKHDMDTNLHDFSDTSMVLESNNMVGNYLMSRVQAGNRHLSQVSPEAERGVGNFLSIPCYEPWTTLVIHPDGYADPCEMTNNLIHIGERSLRDVWYNDQRIRALRENFSRQELPGGCVKCCGPLVSSNVRIREMLGRVGR